MITLGGSLIAIAAALIGVYAARISNLHVKLPISDAVLWVLIGIFFVSGLSLSIIGIVRTWGDVTPRQRERERRLRVHFEDMLSKSQNLIPDFSHYCGRIDVSNMVGDMPSPVEIQKDTLTNFPPEFTAHFPNMAKLWEGYRSDIYNHNDEYTKLKSEIRDAFSNLGLEINHNRSKDKPPFIYEQVYKFLFDWWRAPYPEMNENNPIPRPDIVDISLNGLVVGAIAKPGNDDDKQKFIGMIKQVALNPDLNQEATKLFASARGLCDSIQELKRQLTDTMQEIQHNYQFPGIKEVGFKRLKQCPICQEKV
jgi:hypothetical protein